MAGSSNTYSKSVESIGTKRYEIHQWSWVADDSDGSVPSAASTNKVNGIIEFAETNPGSVAPQDNYDITLTNDNDVDVFGAALNDRDTANEEQCVPAIGSKHGDRPVNSVLTMALSGNNVNSATGTLKVYVRRN